MRETRASLDDGASERRERETAVKRSAKCVVVRPLSAFAGSESKHRMQNIY